MNSLWKEVDAAQYTTLLQQRVYSSRLLGSDPSLVLHGGGNTSVKITEPDVFGVDREILYVKGSGADLAVIDEQGFTPLELDHVRRLASLDRLSDPDMVRELAAHCIRPGAPAASIEAILHAIIPHRFVDHTHADAIVSLTNTANGAKRIAEIYGDDVLVIPYVMPGFALAKACAEALKNASPNIKGIVLLHHGIFSFGDSAKESYGNMIALVSRAEEYLVARGAWSVVGSAVPPTSPPNVAAIARLRHTISQWARRPMIMRMFSDPRSLSFARRPDVATLAQQGPSTPDHIIRTKRAPLIGRDAEGYVLEYDRYFEHCSARVSTPLTALDPAPRIVIDPDFGICAAGRTVREADIVGDIYAHTIDNILRSTALGGCVPLTEQELFEIEYWDLEQAKLRSSGAPPALTGEIAVVTGAASGIGRACVAALLARGAVVAGIDVNPDVSAMHDRPEYLGITCDLTDDTAVAHALSTIVQRYGGIDMLVANAGIFPPAIKLAELRASELQRTMYVNSDSAFSLMQQCYPMLRLAPRYGRIVIVGSRNVPAPGPGVAAYSASKAALTQLARVAALEWGADGIRVNVVHPHGIFDTGIWKDGILEQRAEQYGMTVAQYKKRNVLGVEVVSRDVAELVAELCGPAFAKITGAQIPIDGGNDRVI